MTYVPPTDDMKFALRHLADFSAVARLPAFAETGLDLADAVIDEAAKLAADIIAPLITPLISKAPLMLRQTAL